MASPKTSSSKKADGPSNEQIVNAAQYLNLLSKTGDIEIDTKVKAILDSLRKATAHMDEANAALDELVLKIQLSHMSGSKAPNK